MFPAGSQKIVAINKEIQQIEIGSVEIHLMVLQVIFSKSADVWVQSILNRRPNQIGTTSVLTFISNS